MRSEFSFRSCLWELGGGGEEGWDGAEKELRRSAGTKGREGARPLAFHPHGVRRRAGMDSFRGGVCLMLLRGSSLAG